ncbi:hypothetical protein [Caproiciproducens sp.]
MEKKQTFARIILALVGVFCLLFWLGLLFYSSFLGGSPGPGYERNVPAAYVGMIASGLLGAILGLIGVVTRKPRTPLFAAAFGILGSIPFFLLSLPEIGILALIAGIEPLLGLFTRKKGRKEEKAIDG